MNESWHPYWAWEHLYFGFFELDRIGCGVRENERLRKEFFLTESLFHATCIEVAKNWPVCADHFLTGQKVNPISWLGQVASFYCTGVTSKYSYTYNQLSKAERSKNNQIARLFISEWRECRDSKNNNGVYKRVEKKRLQRGFTPKLPRFFVKKGIGSELQGDLFGDSSK